MTTNDGDDFPTRGPVVLAVTIAMIVCSTVFLAFRLASRVFVVKKTGWDDYFMLFAWILSFGLSFSICYGVRYGLGRHESDVPDAWDPKLKRLEYVFTVLYNPCLMATKTSILAFYLTLSKSRRFFKWAVIATLFVVNLGGIALTILNILQCRPINAAFLNPVPSTAHCTDIVTLYLSSAPLNIITDLAILFLPMPVLTSMRLPRKQKAILVITFGFGAFAAVVDVVRIAYLQSAAITRLKDIRAYEQSSAETRNSEQSDFSWYASLSFMWSAIEVNVGIMCGCVPALKPLVSRFLPRVLRDVGDTIHSQTHRRQTLTSVDMVNAQRIPSAETPEEQPRNGDPDEPMDMMDFLTTPDMDELPPMQRTATALTNSTRHTAARSMTFFDFVNFQRKKSMVQMTNQESYFPIAMVTILFFVWGFAYGLLDTLNQRFQEIAKMSIGQSISIHSLYFAGYFVGPLTFGRIVLRKCGFKACYIVGLCIYACGTLIFWPSAVLTSYPAFLVSNFIIGLGLSTLEIAANPFTALCGPPQYAEIRLNISQGVQAIATVASPLLAKKVLFKIDADSLIDVQWTYFGIALFTVLLAVAYYYIPLPEATDQELEDAAERADDANNARIGNVRILWITLGLGIFSQFCYVGAQESVSTSFSTYFSVIAPYIQQTNHMAYSHTAFAVSRFLAAFANFFIKPRIVLLVCFIGVMVFSIVALHARNDLSAVAVVFVYFFEGPIFSLIYAQCLRGLGRYTKDGSAAIVASVSGGAVLPLIFYAVQITHGVSYAYCVPIAAAAFGTILPIYFCILPAAKKQVDPIDIGSYAEHELSTQVSLTNSAPRRHSKRIFKFHLRKRKDKEMELPAVQQKERKSWPSL